MTNAKTKKKAVRTEHPVEKQCRLHGIKELLGLRVLAVRYMTPEEAQELGWYKRPLVLELENGTMLFASMDDEGNDGGSLFGQNKKGEALTFPTMRGI